VEKGFNSDINLNGLTYHVQTEDWGACNPYLVSRVYFNGAVVKSIKTTYLEVLPKGLVSGSRAIQMAMQFQHQKILDLLVSGQLL